MRTSAKLCKKINGLFPLPRHPFNLQSGGVMTYGEWQYEKGKDTIKFYLCFTDAREMFFGKVVLDIGCGAAGKSLYYASLGAEKIYGVDILESYKAEACALAQKLGLAGKFEFVCADASALPFEDGSADTIIMNDAMEHVANPEKVLREAMRTLRRGGRLYLNFPPYYHPFGAHLSDAIGIPWVQLFFSDAALIEVYRDAVRNLPDGPRRLAFRISRGEDGEEYFSYINKMTIRKFKEILKRTSITPVYYHEAPLRGFLSPLARVAGLKEGLVKMVVCVLEKN
ncbi:MAG: class I SAM-dependent methyltransferase [Clostridiales bacterium]|jgi:SAM-dependent methyltransferase|nr:class I SAM-dependent methyltransferase [Clostridiales bacterium]